MEYSEDFMNFIDDVHDSIYVGELGHRTKVSVDGNTNMVMMYAICPFIDFGDVSTELFGYGIILTWHYNESEKILALTEARIDHTHAHLWGKYVANTWVEEDFTDDEYPLFAEQESLVDEVISQANDSLMQLFWGEFYLGEERITLGDKTNDVWVFNEEEQDNG